MLNPAAGWRRTCPTHPEAQRNSERFPSYDSLLTIAGEAASRVSVEKSPSQRWEIEVSSISLRNGIVVTLLTALIGLAMPLPALAGTLTLVIDGQAHTLTYAGDKGTGGG